MEQFAITRPTSILRPSEPATFKGTGRGGVPTVTDGSHTANVALMGNYIASTFTTSSDHIDLVPSSVASKYPCERCAEVSLRRVTPSSIAS